MSYSTSSVYVLRADRETFDDTSARDIARHWSGMAFRRDSRF